MEEMCETCWKLFSQTGEISYYLLYNALKEDNNLVGTDQV
ncbi:MAG: YqzL family protein [Clostridia bacterium]|nr:YqzL family protein [Clostridia bacterium]